MRVYSLTEMTAVPQLRRFVFTNSEEESGGVLEVTVRERRLWRDQVCLGGVEGAR